MKFLLLVAMLVAYTYAATCAATTGTCGSDTRVDSAKADQEIPTTETCGAGTNEACTYENFCCRNDKCIDLEVTCAEGTLLDNAAAQEDATAANAPTTCCYETVPDSCQALTPAGVCADWKVVDHSKDKVATTAVDAENYSDNCCKTPAAGTCGQLALLETDASTCTSPKTPVIANAANTADAASFDANCCEDPPAAVTPASVGALAATAWIVSFFLRN